jgi:hypothetical protein
MKQRTILLREENIMLATERKNMSPLKLVVWGCVGLALLGCVVGAIFFFWLFTGPEGGVKLANEMDAYALDYLADHHILETDERIIAYYDATLSMDGSEAIILTDQRLMHHRNSRTSAVLLTDIEDVYHHREAFIGDIFEVSCRTGLPMKLEIAPLNGGETFHRALMDAWQKQRSE